MQLPRRASLPRTTTISCGSVPFLLPKMPIVVTPPQPPAIQLSLSLSSLNPWSGTDFLCTLHTFAPGLNLASH
uniref:Uncharacterized protein n=1 Tax=Mycena chlorophos TaxID=658473 RepID=A0ABQ0LZH5_MYCCL|nr:predicted protein [Mycena chlorophos]